MTLPAITRRIRRCESDVPAQLVLEYAIAEAVEVEREAIIALAAKQGWAMKNEDPFEDAVREICDMRKRPNDKAQARAKAATPL